MFNRNGIKNAPLDELLKPSMHDDIQISNTIIRDLHIGIDEKDIAYAIECIQQKLTKLAVHHSTIIDLLEAAGSELELNGGNEDLVSEMKELWVDIR